MKGKITKEYWVSCGKCGSEKVLNTNQNVRPTQAAVILGYKKTRVHGWVCPDCQ